MKSIVYLLLMVSFSVFSQDEKPTKVEKKKGSFFFYWGWNRDKYTTSDIHFQGNDYDFTLYDVKAVEKVTPFSARVYLNPGTVTIPQYNMRIGYFFHEKYSLSFGSDHMKYVMVNDQQSTIKGTISNNGSFNGTWNEKTPYFISQNFLKFEHTDGLNYLNLEARRHDKLWEKSFFRLNYQLGFGAGILLPRTNTTLMKNARYDQFHLAGFGIAPVGALSFEFFKRFFIQTEVKPGFIAMPSIRTTMYKWDKASQHFSFLQWNIVFGVNFNYKK